MQQANEDAETLRRVDAIGDATLSQAIREALARRSDAARVEAMNDDERAAWDASENARLDAWIPDLSRPLNEAEGASLNTFYTDEAAVRLVVPPFALLQLNTDVRGKVLAFLLCTSQDHALRAVAASRVPERPDAIKHETTRSLLYSPPLSGNEIAVFSNRGGSSTVLRGAAPHSTAALVDTLFHHTAALRVVCTELHTDAMALSSAANSEATPRSWLANLYCRRDTALDDETVVCELRARALSGRRANTVRDLFLRKDACSGFTPPERGRASVYSNFASRSSSGNARVLCTSAPSGWSERRSDMARLLSFLSNTSSSSLEATRSAHARTRVLTVDEANRNAPVDEELLQSLSNVAVKSALTSFRGATVTLVAESISLKWIEGEESGPSPPSNCYARLEEQLGQFFGDRSGDGWINRWTNKPPYQVFDDHVDNVINSENYAETSHYYHDSSRPPITALEDIIAANATETKLTTDAFTALGEVEFAGDVKPTLYDEGSGIFRKSSYTIVPISAKFHAGGEKRDCFIEGHCCRGAMDSVELNVPFLVESEHGELEDPVDEGYFIAEIRARIPGFD